MLSLLIIVMILAIVFFQAVHGIFSSLIMAICTLVCTLLAFNAYEPLVSLFGLHDRIPAYADGIMLVALMVIPLYGIRFAVDNYLPGNIVPNVWVDRVGGGAFGLITALLLVGTLVIALQMLPFDRGILGWDPYDDGLQPTGSLTVDAPGFTLGLVHKLSAGSMGGRPFAEIHPEFRLELWALRNRQKGGRNDCLPVDLVLKHVTDVSSLLYPGEVEVAGWPTPTFQTHAPAYPGVDSSDSQVFVVRVDVTDNARDTDDWWRLRGTQLRLVTAAGKGYYPVAYMVNMGEWQVMRGDVGALQVSRPWTRTTTMLTADFLFRVPFDAGRRPAPLSHVAFRGVAKQAIAKVKTVASLADLPYAKALQMKETYGRVTVSGRTPYHVFKAREAVVERSVPSMFGRARKRGAATGAPESLRLGGGNTRVDVTLVGGYMQSGTVTGPTDALYNIEGANERNLAVINQFVEPQGMKMVKLYGEAVKTGLLILKPEVFVQAQVFISDGEVIPVSGAWVRWTAGGAKYVHYYYSAKRREWEEFLSRPDSDLLAVMKTYKTHRQNVTEIGMIFLVPDTAKVTAFRLTGRDRFNCENPLSVGRRPRAPRRPRR